VAYNFVPCDRNQSFLMPPSLDDWLPKAPSPTASTGARIPRRRQSRSSSAQDSVDSRDPSASAMSSLVPSVRTPTMTSTQRRSSSPRRTVKCTPSTQHYT